MKKTLVALGPFWHLKPSLDRVRVMTEVNALVPRQEIYLDNKRIYKILKSGDDYYIVYETDNIDFYQPYLAKLPKKYEEIEKLELNVCKRCGSPVEIEVDADDVGAYCPRCEIEVETETVTVWTKKEPLENVIEGEGIYILKNRTGTPYTEYKVLAEGIEKLGNIEAKYKDFIGYYCWENIWGKRCNYIMVYRRYSTSIGEYTVTLRELTEEEKLELFNNTNNLLLKVAICNELKTEECKKVVDEYNKMKKKEPSPAEKLMEMVKKELPDLPIEFQYRRGVLEVFLKQRVDRDKFNKFVAVCKSLGFQFDSYSKTWKFVVETLD
ncbi:MAG: hypothetical protein QXD36_06800 [Sulfolobales archaeon]